MMRKISRTKKMVFAKKIILHQIIINAIDAIMKKLECLDVKENVLSLLKEKKQLYEKVDVRKDILNHLRVYVNLVILLRKDVINVIMKIQVILRIIQISK